MEEEQDKEQPPMQVTRIERDEDSPGFAMVTDSQIQMAEKSVANIVKIKQLALRVTNRNDWVDLGGKPYLTESGSMKIASLFGISFRKIYVEREDDEIQGEPVIRFIAKVTASFNGREIEVEGIGSSDDDFFCKSKGQ